MKKGTSLYLDLVRILAALMVFLEHLREHTRNSFGAFWRSHPFWFFYSDPLSLVAGVAVFVLSGYVIAHVLATRERTPLEFAASRIARLYSVAVPALVLAATTNYLEALRYPHAFDAYAGIPDTVRYLGAGLFATNYWLWPDLAPPNIPFWRLSYEVSYYVGIALFVFARGRTRILSLIALCLLTGPTTLLLAPTWLIGYGAYHLAQRRQLRTSYAIPLWLGSTVFLFLCPLIELRFRQHLSFLRMPDSSVGGLLASYAEAICFAVSLFAFNGLSGAAEIVFKPFIGLIRWLASATFALYMFHQPLLSFFTVYPVGLSAAARGSLAQAIVLIGGTFLIVGTIGRFFERSKGRCKKWFLWLYGHAANLRLRYEVQKP